MCIEINCITSQVLGTIFGAIVGALASIYATKEIIKSQFDLFDKKEKKETQSATYAIISELHALKDIFDVEITPKIIESSLSFDYQYPNVSDYFSIFNANLNKVGSISNKNVRECIIQIYVTTKYFLDCLATNSEINEQREAIEFKQRYIVPTYIKIMDLFKNLEELENCRGNDNGR